MSPAFSFLRPKTPRPTDSKTSGLRFIRLRKLAAVRSASSGRTDAGDAGTKYGFCLQTDCPRCIAREALEMLASEAD